MPGLIPLNRLLVDIETDPIAGGEAAQRRHEMGVRNGTYESSVSAGALYRALKGTPGLISGFYKLPFWRGDEDKKSYAKNPKHLNKHCHQFVYGARDGSEGKRAEDHAFATQSYYDDESRTLDDILKALKKGGFDSFKKAQSAQETRLRLKEMEAPERKQSNAVSGSRKKRGAGEAAPAGEPPSNGGSNPPSRWPKMTMKEIFEHLLVTMTVDELAQFLPEASDEGDLAAILLMRDKNPTSNRAIWRAMDIEFNPQGTRF